MRNRIKRRIREAFRLHRAEIGRQWDIVVNPRPFVKAKSYFGPDRRRNANLNYVGPERRKGGKADIIKQQALFDKVKMPG